MPEWLKMVGVIYGCVDIVSVFDVSNGYTLMTQLK